LLVPRIPDDPNARFVARSRSLRSLRATAVEFACPASEPAPRTRQEAEMTTTTIETVPEVWDDERDTAFFRIVARLFSPAFCMGAGVLLASYDADDEPAAATTVAAATTSAGGSGARLGVRV
jgi:hypothetical protein